MLSPGVLRAASITTTGWRPPRGDEDAALALRLRHEPFQPVFVLGLDPRLVAWLCAAMTRALPAVTLTLHDTLAFPRLLSLAARGEVAEDRVALQATLAERRLSPALPVEHGWLLRRETGRARLDARSLPALREACQKLLRLRPEAQAVVLWDRTDPLRAPELLTLLPTARFVCLRVDPARLVQARLRQLLGERPRDLDRLLAGKRGGRTARLTLSLLGPRLGRSLLRAWAAQRARQELLGYHAALLALPPARRVEVDDAALLRAPVEELARLGRALGLRPRGEAPPPLPGEV